MKQKTGRKLLSFLLTLALVLGLMPGMGLTAYAALTETLLTTITGAGSNASPATSANISYSAEGVATLTFSEPNENGHVVYQASPAWGWWGYDITLTVTPTEGYTITKCVFYDNDNNTATDSEAPFVVETVWDDKTPKVNGAVISNSSKGIKKIEVYGYATPAATHSVNITAGDHMTKTAGSGDAEQTGLTGAMTDVVYTADNGYYFPTDYSVAEVSGIKVTRDSYTQITVSGTPTADAAIALTAPTAKTTPDAPTTATATDCTTADNNDGKLTGVTTAMEYKKSDAADWTAGTGSDITGLVPGTYYVRVKATETTNASTNQELTIADSLTAKKTAAKADLDTLLAGKTEADYDADDWTTLTQAIADGKTAIDNATTIDDVATAKSNAEASANAVKTTAEKLADAKTAAKAELDTLLAGKTEADYDADDWTALNQAITDGKTAIDNATTIDGVTTAKTNAETAVNAIKTKAEKLADAKTTAKNDLDALLDGKNPDDYDQADWDALTQAINDAKTAIDAATTLDAVEAAKTPAQQAEANTKTKEQKAAEALKNAKDNAKADLDTLQSGKNQNDYDEADWTTLTQAITDGKTAIDNATTTEAITTAKNNAVDAVNAVKTKAQKELDNAKTSAVNTVNAVNANDYIAADQQTVTDAKTTALAAIEAATTEEEVTTALNNFNNAIASCTTQVVADQIAQVMSEVSAKTGSDMTYTGSPIQLINTPTTALPAGYTMKYAVTTENVKPTDENLYTTSIPTATNAGTYYVWCKAVGDANHLDSAAACVTVTVSSLTIAPADVPTSEVVEVDGVKYPVDPVTGAIQIPDSSSARIIETFGYSNGGDAHTTYPTSLKVWVVTEDANGERTAVRVPELDDIMRYSGFSIRVTGNRGIRMITSVPTDKKNALIAAAGLAGFTLEEYGTVVGWADALNGGSLTMSNALGHAYAYKRGAGDAVFKTSGGSTQYTNVLVKFTDEQVSKDLIMRSYMVLSKAGVRYTLYGGSVQRSIGYVAYQNRAAFRPGTAPYEYVWSLIHIAYGNRYDGEYQH